MDVLDFAKIQNQTRQLVGLNKAHYHAEIQKRAAETRSSHESEEQAYTRILLTPDGKELYKAYRNALEPRQAAQDFVPRKKPEPLGPAARELDELAAEVAREKKISREKASARIMADPEHGPLVRHVLAEEQSATAEVKRQRWPMPARV